MPLESFFPLANASDGELCRSLQSISRTSSSSDDGALRRKVVISDLHLGPSETQGEKFRGLDDFFADDAFARLLERLGSPTSKVPTELIVAGDFIDFWQIEEAMGLLPTREEGEPPIAADQQGSLAALDVALAAHPQVFKSLSKFLASGDNRLVFVVGNHDADLAWPRVQLAVARALSQKNLDRLAFVTNAYLDRGVYVGHGHQLDPANQAASASIDKDGRCRLAPSWGQVFVAKFLGELERRFPFVDNLYPESSALMWGSAEEPDVTAPIIAGYRFVDMLINEQSAGLNLEALRAAALALVGAPDSPTSKKWSKVWDGLPVGGSLLSAVSLLTNEKKYAPLRAGIVEAAEALPDIDAALATLERLDLGLLADLKRMLTSDPLESAAASLIASNPEIKTVVFGHTHLLGGTARVVEGGHYANTGSWTPIGSIADLKKRGIGWSDLELGNRNQFKTRLPAVVIDYTADAQPRPPHLVYAN